MNNRNSIDIADPFARQLLLRYLDRRAADVKKLRDALQNADFEAIRVTGHNLLGSGSAYGLDKISSMGENIETAAVAGDRAAIEALLSEMEAFLATVRVR